MKKHWLACLFAGGALCSAQRPEPAVDLVRYGQKDLIHLSAKRGFTSLIMFSVGEEIAEVSCGDSAFWVIDGKDNVLYVKPAKAGAVTNINVVLRSKAIFSFYAEEIGDKGTPDLKLIVGQPEELRLRSENASLAKQLEQGNEAYRAQLNALQKERERAATLATKAIEEAGKITSERLADFLANQRFDFPCYAKTNICVASVLVTDSKTLIVGTLGDTPTFSGWDEKAQYHARVKSRRIKSVYELEYRLIRGSISYGAHTVAFSTR